MIFSGNSGLELAISAGKRVDNTLSFNASMIIHICLLISGYKASSRLVYLVFVFVLMGWSLLPNALRPFEIYCGPPNLGIRT